MEKNRVVLRNGKTSADDSVALQNTQQVQTEEQQISTNTQKHLNCWENKNQNWICVNKENTKF